MAAATARSDLPPIVRRYLDRVLPPDRPIPRSVHLSQSGELRLKPTAKWLRFSAVQESAVSDVAFSWHAHVTMLQLVRLQIVDRYEHGSGVGEVRLFGHMRLLRDSGPPVSEGAALRYLAELVWAPYAIAANRQLEWRELDDATVEAAAHTGPSRVAVRLHFDGSGNVVEVHTDRRPHKERGTYVARGWGGVYGDYGTVGGIEIPRSAEVSWDLPDGVFMWFRATIDALETRT